MFTQTTLQNFAKKKQQLHIAKILIFVAIFCTVICLGAAFATKSSALFAIIVILFGLHIGLWIISLLSSQSSTALWNEFVRPMDSDAEGSIASPILGNEMDASFDRIARVHHYQTYVGDKPALFDKISVTHQLVTYNPDVQYADWKGATYTFSYLVLAVEIGKPLPHIFIDGRSQNHFDLGRTNRNLWSLPKKLSHTNKLQALEGDFYKSFDVYTASNKQIEALTIITPDVMLALRDKGYSFDYELHGTKLYIIANTDIKTPEEYAAYLQAATAALLELVPQITKHTFSDSEPDIPVHPRRQTFWAIWYSMVSLIYVFLYIVLLCCVTWLSAIVITSVY